jgi:PAS domain S-box-containing protein
MDLMSKTNLLSLGYSLDELLLTLFDHTQSIILLLKSDGTLLAINHQAEKIFSLSSKDCPNKNIFSLLSPTQFSFTQQDLQMLKSNLTNIHSELNINGTQLAISWNLSLIQKGNNDTAILMIGNDITGQKKYKNLTLYMEKIIDILPGVMWWKDTQGKYIGCNQAMLKICGLTAKENFIGKTDYDMPWTKEESDHYTDDDKAVMLSQKAKLNIEETQTFPDGRKTVLLTNKVPVFDDLGNIMGTLGTFLDITERKEKEDEINVANEKLKSALAEIQTAREIEVKLRNELITSARLAGMAEVSTSVLHNVGNVLNSVNTSVYIIKSFSNSPLLKLEKTVDLLGQHQADIGSYLTADDKGKMIIPYLKAYIDVTKKTYEDIHHEIDMLSANIEHILAIISTQQTMSSTAGFNEVINLSELIQNAILISMRTVSNDIIKLVTNYQETKLINIDRVKLLQIIVNIIKNATEALFESNNTEKILQISVFAKDKDYFCIEISDNGCGIDSENLNKIFIHGFTTKKKGHGFGLHNCIISAKEMGGTITVESLGSNKGSTFFITLPFNPPI